MNSKIPFGTLAGAVATLSLLSAQAVVSAQLDLRSWSLVDPYNRWSKTNPTPTTCRMDETASSSTVGPGWVVSPFALRATASFEVTLQATGNGDDDFVGIAFSYQSSTKHVLLDWKKFGQTFNWGDTVAVNDDNAELGMKLKKIDGSFTRDGLWGGTDGLGVSTFAGPLAPGWADNTAYRFEFSITPGRVVIRRNGVQIFDVSNPAITAGRIAFYSFSQDNVTFSNVHACPADFDGDGFVTGDDFDAFVADFEAGNSAADFDYDGFVTGDDFDAYVVAFAAGC